MTRQLDAWADDIRNNDKQQHRALWHYINWPSSMDNHQAYKSESPEVLFHASAFVLRVSPGQSRARKGTGFYLGRGLPALLRCHPIASVGSVLVQLEQYRCS